MLDATDYYLDQHFRNEELQEQAESLGMTVPEMLDKRRLNEHLAREAEQEHNDKF